MFFERIGRRDDASLNNAKAFLTRRFSSGTSSYVVLSGHVFFWLLIGVALLARCYGVDVWVATALLAVILASTTLVAFLLGMLRSASFVVSIDAAELGCLYLPNETNVKHQVMLGVTMRDVPVEANVLAAAEELVQQRVDALKCRYSLSGREAEVLYMLAKGRDANYISDALCISQHTAKCHIYHIYQKTNVHSKQELINLFEESLLVG